MSTDTPTVAVITGASSAIGEATARATVADQFGGAEVLINLSADEVAAVIAFALGRPRDVSLNEILIRPTAQAL